MEGANTCGLTSSSSASIGAFSAVVVRRIFPEGASSFLVASPYLRHTSSVMKGGSINTKSNVPQSSSGMSSGWL